MPKRRDWCIGTNGAAISFFMVVTHEAKAIEMTRRDSDLDGASAACKSPAVTILHRSPRQHQPPVTLI